MHVSNFIFNNKRVDTELIDSVWNDGTIELRRKADKYYICSPLAFGYFEILSRHLSEDLAVELFESFRKGYKKVEYNF